ncbi:Eco57I restriction-modification methylase domain-containing protein [Pseudobacillus badius]|uniref:Eco57I restriction-modification methylase domain-containing protein n=1 Tax=Bacillus badius TaxID=1455 RepID=UPI0024A1AA21|nr:TaqI-like C-terminal specificity domain-containing protein [Bacillus badius]MED0667951.1 TaqI-like C-terminal specificity domain-containing protein [Bacillus badius]GLY11443.1 hypothetical protein Bbad01_26590 [Bacillus badius]
MSESAKLSLLKDAFESAYDQSKFQRFVKEFFNEPKMLQASRKTTIWREYNDHVASYSLIAKYTDRESNDLIVLSVELKKNQSIERARTLQRNFISKVLEQQGYDAAIVALYAPDANTWRLSFVRLDYTFNEKGLSLDLTPARRYSYLVGEEEPNHTAQKQLLEIFKNDEINPTLDEIENAFSVERVTKDFYKQYEMKYLELKEYLEANPAFIEETERLKLKPKKFAEQFAKKLMGQLAFLYFVQKKGWLGVRILPESRQLLESDYQDIYSDVDTVHRSILDKVFMKTKEGKRRITSESLNSLSDHEVALFSECFVGTKFEEPWGNGNKTFIREIFNFCDKKTKQNFFDDFLEPLFYEALNKKRKNHYFRLFNCKIPFLNGGLFEPLEGYRWKDVNFKIPNELFSNLTEKGREADGILDVFDRFNFTINEAEPLEKDVAVDPEMLGKIFENLLDVRDRKSKGAFYTPREIVHYMCQESLINYLSNELDIPREDLKEFILYGDLIKDVDSRSGAGYQTQLSIKQTVFDNIVRIDNALKNIKIADPAVGSGAFPLGMLSEIVRARNNITEYIVKKDKEGAFEVVYGEERIRKKRSPYDLKWETIKNSIFAVDIEASAVDIAKLRLWLSVIVEQEINTDTPEPHPLPNLDCNILVGDALNDEYNGIKLFDEKILHKRSRSKKGTINSSLQLSLLIDNSDELLNEMFKLQDRYFDEEDEQKKKQLKYKIDQIRDDLIEYKLHSDGDKSAYESYIKLKQKNQKPYFLWYLEFAKVFQKKKGFDIVIGNPPYAAKFNKKYKNYLDSKYPNVPDYESSNYFICKALEILKPDGIMSYIIPNMVLSNHFATKFREQLTNEWTFIKIDNLSEIEIFESATVRNCIFTFKKRKSKDFKCDFINADLKDHLHFPRNQKTFTKKFLLENKNNWMNFLYQDERVVSLINKIKTLTVTLEEIADVSQGLIPYDKYRGHSEETIKNRIWHSKTKINETYKKELKGKDVRRYALNWSGDNWISYGNWLAAPRKPEFFVNPRILIREITNPEILATYTEDEFYNTPSIINIINFKVHPLYLLGVINSSLMSFYHVNTSPKAKKGLFPKILVNDVKNLPIRDDNSDRKNEVISLVEKLLSLHKDNEVPDEEVLSVINQYESRIDELVNEIYKLDEKEVSLLGHKNIEINIT